MGSSMRDTEATRRSWLKEQYDLAAQVRVLDDDLSESIVLAEQDDFYLARFGSNNTDKAAKGGDVGNEYYGGVDVSFPENEQDLSVAVYVIVDKATMKVVYQDHEYFRPTIPYIPSFLAFREIDPLRRLVEAQKKKLPELTPRCILVDGNGILHPRGAGIACFLGVQCRIPTIGIGKTLFYQGLLDKEFVWRKMDESLARANATLPDILFPQGDNLVIFDQQCIQRTEPNVGPTSEENKTEDEEEHEKFGRGIIPHGFDRGAAVQNLTSFCRGLAIPLVAALDGSDDNEDVRTSGSPKVLASVLVGHGGRSSANHLQKSGTKVPIFVSVGHDISLQQAVLTAASLSQVRIPEPVRQADLIGRRLLRQGENQKLKK